MKEDGSFNQIVIMAASDATRASGIVAKAFYKVLKKNGFSDEQIINVSTCILDCLLQSLSGYKEKAEAASGKTAVSKPQKEQVRKNGRRRRPVNGEDPMRPMGAEMTAPEN
jgi:hypothetical protein